MTDLRRLAALVTIIDHLEQRPEGPALPLARAERDYLLAEYAQEAIEAQRARSDALKQATTKARKPR